MPHYSGHFEVETRLSRTSAFFSKWNLSPPMEFTKFFLKFLFHTIPCRCVDDVIKAVFQFITLLKKSSVLIHPDPQHPQPPSPSSNDKNKEAEPDNPNACPLPPLEAFFREIQHLSASQFETKEPEPAAVYARCAQYRA